jgi:hypothetical protein
MRQSRPRQKKTEFHQTLLEKETAMRIKELHVQKDSEVIDVFHDGHRFLRITDLSLADQLLGEIAARGWTLIPIGV